MKLIITGGRQSNSSLSYFNKEWSNGICGVVYEYDTKNNNLEEKVNYKTPLKFRPKENFSISFKSGSIYENKLYITTLTEVLIYSLPKYTLEERISLKIFNDLHHVIKHNNDLYIVVTGLDIVVRYSLSKKKVLFIYNCFPEVDTWNRFDKKKDYRKINTTKPHFSHPNHVTIYNDKLYITNIILNQGIPHDGCIFNNKFIYTVVNGKIIEINKNNFNEKKIIDLNKFQNDNKSLGWCRGFQKIDSKNYVAFSRIRPTKFIENVKWLGTKLSDKVKLKMPTRLVCYDENYSRLLKEINLEDYGINWIFSILKN
jgi:hypothetical protein